MGFYARVPSEIGDLPEFDAARTAQEAPVWNVAPGAPISGCVLRNGKPIPFTLETPKMKPEGYRLLPEQIVMGSLLLMSFVVPIVHFLG